MIIRIFKHKLTLELHDVGKIGMTLVAALEGAELLFTIVSDTGTGTIIHLKCTTKYLLQYLKSPRRSQIMPIR
jgi:hypothetical protein